MFWFITSTIDTKSLVFQWNVQSELRYTIDKKDALKYRDTIKKYSPQITTVEVKIFGKVYTMSLPYFPWNLDDAISAGYIDASHHLIQYIYTAISHKIITDDTFLMAWKKFLMNYKVIFHKEKQQLLFLKWSNEEYIRDWELPTEALFYYKKLIEHRFVSKRNPRKILAKDQNWKDILETLNIGRDKIIDTEEWGRVTIPWIYTDTLDELYAMDSAINKMIGKPKKDFQRHIESSLLKRNLIIAARQIGKTHVGVSEVRDELFSYNFFPSDQIKVGLMASTYSVNRKILRDLTHIMREFVHNGIFKSSVINSGSQGASLFNYSESGKGPIKYPHATIYGMSEESKSWFDGEQGNIIYIDEVEKLSFASLTKIMPMILRNPLSKLIMTTTLKETGELTWVSELLMEYEQEVMKKKNLGTTPSEVVRSIVNKYQLYKYSTIEEMLDNNVDLYQARVDLYSADLRDWAQRYPIWDDETMTMDQKKMIVREAMAKDPQQALAEYECVLTKADKPLKRDRVEVNKNVDDIIRGRGGKKFPFILYILDPKWSGHDDRKMQARVFDSQVDSETFNKFIGLKSWEIRGKEEQQAKSILENISSFNDSYHKNGVKTQQYLFGYDVNGVGQMMEGYLEGVWLPIWFKFHAVRGTKRWYQKKKQDDYKLYYTSKQLLIKDMIDFIGEDNMIITNEMGETGKQMDQFTSTVTEKNEVIYGAKTRKDETGAWHNDGEIACMSMAFAYFSYQVKMVDLVKQNRGAELERMIKKMGRDDYRKLLEETTGDPLDKFFMNQEESEIDKLKREEAEKQKQRGRIVWRFWY